MRNQTLEGVINIGPTVARALAGIRINTLSDLRRIGAAGAYRKLSRLSPQKHLPFCYYLYSLQGAIEGLDWRLLTEEEKTGLRQAAKASGRGARRSVRKN